MRPTVSNCLCCGACSSADDDDAAPSGGGAAATGDDPESNGGSLVPLCYVMEGKSGLGAAEMRAPCAWPKRQARHCARNPSHLTLTPSGERHHT